MWRRYRTTEGYWGFGFGHSPLGWHVQIGRWVFTTEETGYTEDA